MRGGSGNFGTAASGIAALKRQSQEIVMTRGTRRFILAKQGAVSGAAVVATFETR
jgi:hypothetical protein